MLEDDRETYMVAEATPTREEDGEIYLKTRERKRERERVKSTCKYERSVSDFVPCPLRSSIPGRGQRCERRCPASRSLVGCPDVVILTQH